MSIFTQEKIIRVVLKLLSLGIVGTTREFPALIHACFVVKPGTEDDDTFPPP